jgi:hypothetical protein
MSVCPSIDSTIDINITDKWLLFVKLDMNSMTMKTISSLHEILGRTLQYKIITSYFLTSSQHY